MNNTINSNLLNITTMEERENNDKEFTYIDITKQNDYNLNENDNSHSNEYIILNKRNILKNKIKDLIILK